MHSMFKKGIAIIVIIVSVILVFSGCNHKLYNGKDDYRIKISEFAEKYGYEIISESTPWTDTYKISISNGTEQFDFTFKMGKEKQINYFEIWCENPVSFDSFLEIANELSKKEFSEKFYYNVIENENPFYNKDDEEHSYYKDDYDFYKYDFLGITEDYNVNYYSTSGYTTLCIAGFTK